jgi:ech hydrogenase subunit A
MWAAIFILIFHAVAKALLFCCVGTGEHHIGSRDIESMDGLFERMPALALLMSLGMLGMFVAPFGMLIGKWATIVSLLGSNNLILVFVLAFGSALTFVFWSKWLGKLLAIAQGGENLEKTVNRSEWFGLGLMSALVVLAAAALPAISESVVIPYIDGVASFASGFAKEGIGSTIDVNNLIIMSIVLVVLFAAFSIQFNRGRKAPTDTVYLSGVGVSSNSRSFKNSLGGVTEATQRNWYMESIFGNKVLSQVATALAIVIMLGFFVTGLLIQVGVL